MQKPVEVSKTEDGVRLLRWFLRRYPGMPQKDFYKLCRGGQIRVNSARCQGQEILHSGDHVRVPPTLSQYQQDKNKKTETGESFSLADLEELRKRIIHSDNDIVVFDKPAGLAVQGGTGIKKSIDKMAIAMFPYDKVSLVHRLDRETSGVLVVAKNQKAAQILAQEFQNKQVQKKYLALLSGSVSPKSGTIDNFITKGRVVAANEDATEDARPQRAITDYKVVSELSGVLSWVLFSPKTGRTHQLRIHSAFSLGAPIVGDTIYGREKSVNSTLDSVISTKNLFLVAYKLSFSHPGNGRIVTFRADLPEFMQPVIKFLEFKVPK